MNWNLVALDAVKSQPWRNGRGITRELLAWPSPDAWRVRMSLADLNGTAPFSRFEGIERWFAVVEGDGVVLHAHGQEQLLTRASPPVRFDGDSPMYGTIFIGLTRDFNLMAPPGAAQMWRVRGRRSLHARAGQLLAVYCHREAGRVDLGGCRLDVPPRHFAWAQLEQAATGTLVCDHALWMEVTP